MGAYSGGFIHYSRCFHFLGGIHFAIGLIAFAALMVAVGTWIESHTGSHLLAAKWTYAHPLFALLLSLFFINILFAALRRWPFRRRHFPFLITHLGLLMIIGGTLIKNHLGVQGQLSVWEGSGSSSLLLPHTYALSVESLVDPAQMTCIPLTSFEPATYRPFPNLRCTLTAFAPHVKEELEAWIKGERAYISGFPSIQVTTWTPTMPLPAGVPSLDPSALHGLLVAIKTPQLQAAKEQLYLHNLMLRLKEKGECGSILDIPLVEAIQCPFSFAHGEMTVTVDLKTFPSVSLAWRSNQSDWEENFRISLQGEEALFLTSDSPWQIDPLFTADLIRPQAVVCLIEEAHGELLLYVLDPHGRIHEETFNASWQGRRVAHAGGAAGYTAEATVPFPSFRSGREEKDKASAYFLEKQLRHTLSEKPLLSPPLCLFEQACKKAQVDFPAAFVEFLTTWHEEGGILHRFSSSFSISLQSALEQLDWEIVSPDDRLTCQWTCRLLDGLEQAMRQGRHPLDELQRQHWPLLAQLGQQLASGDSVDPFNLLTQQVASLGAYLPPFALSPLADQAHLLSAYLRLYALDYRALFPRRSLDKESFHALEAYWKSQGDEGTQTTLLETPLTHRLIPDTPPVRWEEHRPGIILEVEQGDAKQSIALAYDASGMGMQWPILRGRYLVRFQPQIRMLPYRVRLRQARQIAYPESPQIYSYESDVLITDQVHPPMETTLSMNHVYETWDGTRFYLSGVGLSPDPAVKRIRLAVNHDPAKYWLTYPGACLVFLGVFLLFWSPFQRDKFL